MMAVSETVSSFGSGNTFRELDRPWLGLAIGDILEFAYRA
jgi:hypothetical protein